MTHEHSTSTLFGCPYLRALTLLKQLPHYPLIHWVHLVARTTTPKEIQVLPSFCLLGWGAWGEIAEV